MRLKLPCTDNMSTCSWLLDGKVRNVQRAQRWRNRSRTATYDFDLPFEETLKQHRTKLNCSDFGKDAMRRWWREKEFSNVLNEESITAERDMENIVHDICHTVMNKDKQK